jgi:hypothetical protein
LRIKRRLFCGLTPFSFRGLALMGEDKRKGRKKLVLIKDRKEGLTWKNIKKGLKKLRTKRFFL